MVKIGEGTLFSSECVTKFYRLPVTAGKDSIFVNTGRNSVSSIKVQDQKLLQTWTLPHPHSLTCPVAFSEEDGTLCCVCDSDTLMIWQKKNDTLKRSTKIKFPSPIFSVFSLPGLKCFAVFASGIVLPISELILDPKMISSIQEPNLDGDLMWVDAMHNGRDKEVLLTFLTVKKKKHKLWSCCLNLENFSLNVVQSHSLTKKDVKLLSWCTGWLSTSPVFITAWNNGEVWSYSLEEGEPSLLLTLSDVDDTVGVALECLDKSHLVVVKNKNHVKKSAVLEVWDLKYLTMKAKEPIKHSISKNFQIKAVESNIFISTNNGVVVVPVQLEGSTLSAVVGKAVGPSENIAKFYEWNEEGELCESEPPESSKDTFEVTDSRCTAEMLEKLFKEVSPDTAKTSFSELARRRDISEYELVKMVKLALKNSDGMKVINENGSINFLLLCSVFSIKFNDIFLRHQLKKLSSAETAMALQFLLYIFNNRLFSSEEDFWPSDMQVVNWVQLLLQSHFEELLLSDDPHILNLLKMLKIGLLDKLEVYEELHQISYLLKIREKKKILPKKTVETEYSVEVIYF